MYDDFFLKRNQKSFVSNLTLARKGDYSISGNRLIFRCEIGRFT